MATSAGAAERIDYPKTRADTTSDTHFGTKVDDPYRWLENDVRNDTAVAAWVEAQNKVTDAYLTALPGRDAIAKRMKQLWDFEKFMLPKKAGSRYFFERNSGVQNQFVLYVQDSLDAAPRQLIDPNGWSKDGATALSDWKPSPDGTRLVYSIQDGGSDWRTVKVLNVADGQTLADELKWVKFSDLSWAKDGSGFYYSRFPEPAKGAEFQAANTNQSVYFHKLGDPQSADRLVYATPMRATLGHTAEVTDDGRWLVVTSYEGTDDRYEVHVVDLATTGAKPRAIATDLKHNWQFAGTHGDTLYFVTNKEAPRGRIVSVNARTGDENKLTQLVAETPTALQRATVIGERIVASYLEDAKTVVRTHALDGKLASTLALPGVGTAVGFDGEAGDAETFYQYSSFNAPPTIYRYDAATGRSTIFKAPKTPFNAADYEVKQVFFTSKDGTRVPMFVTHKKGLDLSKGAPTILYGYGGFNVPVLPAFSTSRLAWMELGGVYAVANIRGGSEYGKAWHDAGRLFNKQNVFDDFIAAAEQLVKSGVTTPQQLAVMGGSNGGLLVGAVVNQRPDLFAVGLPAVGVMDMLRYNQFTAGRYWVDDYGDPADEKHFRNLLAYSPYHNVKAGTAYPAILVTTADTDDRVVPGHSFKYAARLQSVDLGPKPHLIRIETRAGHGSGKPTDKIIDELADTWAFTAANTGMTIKLP
ncbi:prolyl oligopeptidase family protein [Sphingoaurantiacus capsulatus]|uniref:prolyl oligopeptidase n=1 Tax=Sphingoaurantiacus capsulatus TaxID=1771310 RepID=A0ABV7X9J7_9SPHN